MLKTITENTDYSFEELGLTLESLGFQNVKFTFEVSEIFTDSLDFRHNGINWVQPSIEQFIVNKRGVQLEFYKGYEILVSYKFYKKTKDKISFSLEQYKQLVKESFDRFEFLNSEIKIDLTVCIQSNRTFYNLKNCQKQIQIHILFMDLKNEYKVNPITYHKIH
jgi:hypothetical protein